MEIDKTLKAEVLELSKIKHLMSDWESHPKGDHGPNDKGGFIETIESAIMHNWRISEKQEAIVHRMYKHHVLGEVDSKTRGDIQGDKDSFTAKNGIEGVRLSEGWRLKINGIVVGPPTSREFAYSIAAFLENSLPSFASALNAVEPAVDDQKQAPEAAQAAPETAEANWAPF